MSIRSKIKYPCPNRWLEYFWLARRIITNIIDNTSADHQAGILPTLARGCDCQISPLLHGVGCSTLCYRLLQLLLFQLPPNKLSVLLTTTATTLSAATHSAVCPVYYYSYYSFSCHPLSSLSCRQLPPTKKRSSFSKSIEIQVNYLPYSR